MRETTTKAQAVNNRTTPVLLGVQQSLAQNLARWTYTTSRIVVGFAMSCALCFVFSNCASSPQSGGAAQQDPQTVVRQFTRCLDSNDVDAALALMAHSSGRTYVAIEQYELRDEVARLQRVLAGSSITKISSAESSETKSVLNIEMDYQYNYVVHCVRVGTRWYISSFVKPSAQQD